MAKKTLDQLADEAIALSAEIKTLDNTITTATDARVERYTALAVITVAAFDQISLEYPKTIGKGTGKGAKYPGRRFAQKAWCERAKLSLSHTQRLVGWGRQPNPRQAISEKLDQDRKSSGTLARKVYKTGQEANTLPGAFAIMIQRIKCKTPEEFMDYESVKGFDVLRLIDFLQTAVAGPRSKAA